MYVPATQLRYLFLRRPYVFYSTCIHNELGGHSTQRDNRLDGRGILVMFCKALMRFWAWETPLGGK